MHGPVGHVRIKSQASFRHPFLASCRLASPSSRSGPKSPQEAPDSASTVANDLIADIRARTFARIALERVRKNTEANEDAEDASIVEEAKGPQQGVAGEGAQEQCSKPLEVRWPEGHDATL